MNDERSRQEDAEALLKDAAILYERYEAGRPEPFNIFTTVRSESDEVNLHSRFLVALLNHRKPGEERRANLEDFINQKSKLVPWTFAHDGAKVERERHYIDILITNDHGQALAIENKIHAVDQHQQLERYHDELPKQGYKNIHILYLTIDGNEPSKDSIGSLDKGKYASIAYKDILHWLERCQKRAYDEPALRESVAQYSRLIKKMTGMDQRSEHMKELKELCLRDNNLLIAHHLANALPHAKASLMHDMWEKIKSVLEENSFTDPIKELSDISEDRIKKAIIYTSGPLAGWFGLYYSFGHEPASLGIEAHRELGFIVGVRCNKEYKEKYDEIKNKLENKFGMGDKRPDLWPWCCILRGDGTGLNPDDIATLSDEKKRKKLSEDIANSAAEKLNAIRNELNTADF